MALASLMASSVLLAISPMSLPVDLFRMRNATLFKHKFVDCTHHEPNYLHGKHPFRMPNDQVLFTNFRQPKVLSDHQHQKRDEVDRHDKNGENEIFIFLVILLILHRREHHGEKEVDQSSTDKVPHILQ